MSSSESSDDVDFSATPEESEMLWRLRQMPPLPPDAYAGFLAQFKATTEQLRNKPVFSGERFTLDE